jgi:hypothetical protein
VLLWLVHVDFEGVVYDDVRADFSRSDALRSSCFTSPIEVRPHACHVEGSCPTHSGLGHPTPFRSIKRPTIVGQ